MSRNVTFFALKACAVQFKSQNDPSEEPKQQNLVKIMKFHENGWNFAKWVIFCGIYPFLRKMWFSWKMVSKIIKIRWVSLLFSLGRKKGNRNFRNSKNFRKSKKIMNFMTIHEISWNFMNFMILEYFRVWAALAGCVRASAPPSQLPDPYMYHTCVCARAQPGMLC